MKRIIAFCLIGILLLSVVGCKSPVSQEQETAGTFVNEAGDGVQQEVSNPESGSVRDRLPKRVEDTVTLADQSVHKLTFSETLDITGRNLHRYTDESNCIYQFDDQGVLIGFKNSYQGVLLDPNEAVTHEQAIQLAVNHMKGVYGEILAGYSPSLLDTDTYYAVYFYTHHGFEGKFRGSDSLRVSVAYDGTINSSSVSWYGSIEGFDEKLVEGITFESLEPFVDKEAKALFPEVYVDSWVKSVYIEKEDGKFHLGIETVVSTGGPETSVVKQAKTFTYPLE